MKGLKLERKDTWGMTLRRSRRGSCVKKVDPGRKGKAIMGEIIDKKRGEISLANGDISPESSPQPLILLFSN